jgi:hypothetical protein
MLGAAAGIVTAPADFLMAQLPILRPPRPVLPVSPATSEELFDCITEIGWKAPLKPRYDRASFVWLIRQASLAVSLGKFRTVIVHDTNGLPCGWLAYFCKTGGTAFLLQLGVRRPEHFGAVLQSLLADAWDQGCATVKGFSRPEQLTTLTQNRCLLRHPGSSALIHSRNPDLLNIVRLGEAALSGLDGERWQRFASESWLV